MQVGDRVVWLYTPRGGYGYTQRIPAVVQKVGGARVRIEVLTKWGERVVRHVRPENLEAA